MTVKPYLFYFVHISFHPAFFSLVSRGMIGKLLARLVYHTAGSTQQMEEELPFLGTALLPRDEAKREKPQHRELYYVRGV